MKASENVHPFFFVVLSYLSRLTSTFPEILRLHLRDEQLGEGVDLSSIARQTQHYSGSDLKGELLLPYYQQFSQYTAR
jgi:hypothetical protein